MISTPFPEFLKQSPCILAEGAVIERLRRSSSFELDPHIVNSAFIYEDVQRKAIEIIYRQYLDIGSQYNLPLLLSTPTWRSSQERITAAGYAHRDVNADNYRFLDALRSSYGTYARNVVIGGLLSCRGDAYRPAEALGVSTAKEFHSWQAIKLSQAGVDFLLAATLPALSEATGLAAALAAAGKPYLVSFIVRPDGTLLDGTPLKTAVSAIDDAVDPQPLAYLVNCTHASIFRSALLHDVNSSSVVRQRIIGLMANTAALNPEELENSAALMAEAPETFGYALAGLHQELGLKILGGCCGTDDRHIRALAARLAAAKSDMLSD
ncbi:MAG: homocysteine S-methyltransferase family protein [Desulfobacterales bacterium]|nr:homocysteine S-methyltransferase family protein [Desulfobacterales bacterium]